MSFTQTVAWTHSRTDRHREFCSGSVASQGTLWVLWHPLGRGSLWGRRGQKRCILCQLERMQSGRVCVWVCLFQLELKIFHICRSAISKEHKQMYLLACVLTVIIEKERKCDSIWEPGPCCSMGDTFNTPWFWPKSYTAIQHPGSQDLYQWALNNSSFIRQAWHLIHCSASNKSLIGLNPVKLIWLAK